MPLLLLQGTQIRMGMLLQGTRSTSSATQALAPTREAAALPPQSLVEYSWCINSARHLPCSAEASSITCCALLHTQRVILFAYLLVSAPALIWPIWKRLVQLMHDSCDVGRTTAFNETEDVLLNPFVCEELWLSWLLVYILHRSESKPSELFIRLAQFRSELCPAICNGSVE